MNYLDKDKKFVWHPFTQVKTAGEPVLISHAKDALLFTHEGKALIDANSSWWTVLHGHCNEKINLAIAQQINQLDHVIFAGVTHPKAIELSEKIISMCGSHFEKVFFSDNGSTSVEVALKMVFQFWFNLNKPKKRIIALEGAYHGDTFGAMSVGERGNFNKPFEHLFFDVDYIPFPSNGNREISLQKLKDLVLENDCAAFIAEPLIQGAAGMRMYSDKWLNEVFKICRENNVLIIADEVMTGFGRTGTNLATQKLAIKPDIVCLSKGLTGGILPLGLTVTHNQIFDAFLHDDTDRALLHGHSFTGNPISCAAACASINLLLNDMTQQKIKEIEQSHFSFIKSIENDLRFTDVNCLGTILSLTLGEGGSDYFNSNRNKLYHHFLSKGILLRPLGNRIFINAPYSITNSQLQEIYQAIKDIV